MILTHRAPFIRHHDDPLYLANGTFGGFQDLSATQMDLWSSLVGSTNAADPDSPVLLPVTLLRTAVWYRNAHYRNRNFWVGRDGLITDDSRYTADPAMPHLPQVYHGEQSLDLSTGLATCSGTLYPGSQAGLEANLTPERVIRYETQTVFLKDRPLMAMEITADADTDILFCPEWLETERLRLDVSGKGVCKIGSDIQCDMQLSQKLLECHQEGPSLTARLQPSGSSPHLIRIDCPGAEPEPLLGRNGFKARGRLTVFVQVSVEDSDPGMPPSFEEVIALQKTAWKSFWQQSAVQLPAKEALWQERYQASLYYVAQSMGKGPTHPGGLSKPNFPHWFGCFHDTDTYFCRPLLESGRPELAAQHLAFRHRTLDKAREIARAHGVTGAQYAWQSDLNGNGSDHHSVMNASIVAVEAAWQVHMGNGHMQAEAVEIIADSLEYLLTFTHEVEGVRRLKPERLLTFSETMEVETPTEALLGIRSVAAALLNLAPDHALAPRARQVVRDFTLSPGPDGTFPIGPGEDPEYMRCPSVTLGSFPLHDLKQDPVMEATFDKELARIMFVFAWLPQQLSAVASQMCRREGPTSAVGLLRQADEFYRDWHAFDEWENRRTGRADHFVTAAGGFATAIHHLLLAETEDGVWSLFPGIPGNWTSLRFDGLITRTGWKVSAELQDGALTHVHAEPAFANASPTLRLGSHFTGPAVPADAETGDNEWVIDLRG